MPSLFNDAFVRRQMPALCNALEAEVEKLYSVPSGYFLLTCARGQEPTQLHFGSNIDKDELVSFLKQLLAEWGHEQPTKM